MTGADYSQTSLAQRLRRRLQRDLSLHLGLNLSRPEYVCAKMTMRCNSLCAHCDIWKIDYAEEELTTAEWISTLDRLRAWLGPFPMVFTGGEALLRPDMLDILRHAAAIDIRAELLSNGLIIDDGMAAALVASGVAQVTISLDGASPGVHDRFRGGSGFHARSTAAILALDHERRQQRRPVQILLKTVISQNNLAELADIARFAGSHNLSLSLQPIEENYAATPDPHWYRSSPWWIHEPARLKEKIDELKSLKRAGVAIVNSDDDLDNVCRYFAEPETLMRSVQAHAVRTWQRGCQAAVASFVISGNGDVRMCYMMEPIGNLKDRPPRQLWSERQRCWTGRCLHRG